MRFSIAFLVLNILSISSTSWALQLGELKLAGNGCFAASPLVTVSAEENRLAFPVRVRVNKKSETSFDRKTCNLRMPIKVGANQKVQLLNLSQVVRVVAYKGAEVKTNLIVGFVGRSSQPLTFEMKAVEDDTSSVQIMKADGLLAESECGRDAILTANLSGLVNGVGTQAFVSTGAALVTLKVVNCNQ
jgi:hypothetical protein